MKTSIGILGGTFNPIHNGHIALALCAYEQFKLDRVLMMLSPLPPHKSGSGLLDLKSRMDMVKLAIADYSGILEFSDFELGRTGYVYTADTMALLKKQNPDNEYYFIMGGDSIRDIEKWYRPDIVMANAVILTAIRDDMDEDALNAHIKHLAAAYRADVRLLKTRRLEVSSTEVRRKAALGESLSGMVPEPVEEYIKNNKLYKLS